MANDVTLGEVKRVDARTIWAHEEHDFTPWLYEHLDKLGEALGLELEAEEREGDVGDFSVDIVARDLPCRVTVEDVADDRIFKNRVGKEESKTLVEAYDDQMKARPLACLAALPTTTAASSNHAAPHSHRRDVNRPQHEVGESP